MRLLVDVPAQWQTHRVGNHVTVAHGAFGSRVDVFPVSSTPIDLQRAIRNDAPPGSRVVDEGEMEAGHARVGWPMRIARARVVDDRNRVVEHRIAAMYELLDWWGIALARLYPSTVEQERDVILAILHGIRPVLWPDEALCIAELWSMEEP